MEASIPVPYCTRHRPYVTEEAAKLLQEVGCDQSEWVCRTPPVKPKGGDVFVYVAESERHISKCKVIVLYI